MDMHGDPIDETPVASATVVLLRDGADGLQAFLLRRHAASSVLGGAHVFPGGKVDIADEDLAARLDLAPEVLHARLHEEALTPAQAAAIHAAAVRELAEETGLLLAHCATSQAARTVWDRLRADIPFEALAAEHGLRLAASALVPWSRWITPRVGGVVRRRFDARFFVARLPEGQQPAHDAHEATESVWLAPATALRTYWAGEIDLAPPQIMSLVQLARHADVASVLREAEARAPALIEPVSWMADGARVICYPGDPQHGVPTRAMHGPTRLYSRAGRFEPDGGLEALLAGRD